MKMVIFVISILILGAGAAFYSHSGGAKKSGPLVIKFATNEWASYAAVPYAVKKGIFAKHNLDVRAQFFKDLPEVHKHVMSGEFDGMTCVISDLVPYYQRRIPMVAVSIVDQSLEGDVLISDSKIKNVADLKGKTIGFETLNSFSHLFVVKILESSGLREEDVRFENVPIHQMPEAILSGKISAGHTFDPTKSRAVSLGLKVLAKAKEVPGLITEVIAFHSEFAEAHPDEIREFNAAVFEAIDEMLKDPKSAAIEVQDFFKNDPTEFAASFSDIKITGLSENRELFSPGNKGYVYNAIDNVSRFYVSRGQLPNEDVLRKLLTSKYLP